MIEVSYPDYVKGKVGKGRDLVQIQRKLRFWHICCLRTLSTIWRLLDVKTRQRHTLFKRLDG